MRLFNDLYGKGKIIIIEPQALIGNTPRLVGLDGNSKMGKSLGNAIYLSDTIGDVNIKVKSAVTDKNRINIKDKGNPDICTVSKYHEVFSRSEFENICEMCRNANISCEACKSLLSKKINSLLDPFRERRAYYEEHKNKVRDIILDGSKKANMVGNETVENVKKAMSIYM